MSYRPRAMYWKKMKKFLENTPHTITDCVQINIEFLVFVCIAIKAKQQVESKNQSLRNADNESLWWGHLLQYKNLTAMIRISEYISDSVNQKFRISDYSELIRWWCLALQICNIAGTDCVRKGCNFCQLASTPKKTYEVLWAWAVIEIQKNMVMQRETCSVHLLA